MPFGEEIGGPDVALLGGRTTTQGYAGDATRQKFTGYEADGETGLNFAQARYQSSLQGRFTSVDPLGRSANVLNPQSFNRYSYVLNNPTNLTDASGMMTGADASQSWGDVSGLFWGSSFDFNGSHFGGPEPDRPDDEGGSGSTPYNGDGIVDADAGETSADEGGSTSELTATVSFTPVAFDMNLPPDPKQPNVGPFFTGFDSILTITLLEDGNPVVGATGTEQVVGSKGEAVDQSPRPVTTDNKGQVFDVVSRGPATANKVSLETAIQVYYENSRKPVDVTTRQTLTLNLPGGGSAQLMFERRLQNTDVNGNLRPSGRATTGPAAHYTITVGPVTVKRLP